MEVESKAKRYNGKTVKKKILRIAQNIADKTSFNVKNLKDKEIKHINVKGIVYQGDL